MVILANLGQLMLDILRTINARVSRDSIRLRNRSKLVEGSLFETRFLLGFSQKIIFRKFLKSSRYGYEQGYINLIPKQGKSSHQSSKS